MRGWKTKLAAGLSIIYGLGGWMAGLHDFSQMIYFVSTGLGFIGIGHKSDKVMTAIEDAETKPIEELVKNNIAAAKNYSEIIKGQPNPFENPPKPFEVPGLKIIKTDDQGKAREIEIPDDLKQLLSKHIDLS